jgi:hypothetical protein
MDLKAIALVQLPFHAHNPTNSLSVHFLTLAGILGMYHRFCYSGVYLYYPKEATATSK